MADALAKGFSPETRGDDDRRRRDGVDGVDGGEKKNNRMGEEMGRDP